MAIDDRVSRRKTIYKATFSHWINAEEPAVGPLSEDDLHEFEFLVEAESIEQANAIARRYEGLEIYAYEGIGELKGIATARDEDRQKLAYLTVFERYP